METSYTLKGYERAFHKAHTRIAHVLHVRLSERNASQMSLSNVYEQAPKAWRWVLARHPRMRAELREKDAYAAKIHAGNVSESTLSATLHVMDNATARSCTWEEYVWRECHAPRPSASETLFAMTIIPRSTTTAIFILFSDHMFSDGFSGYVILRDFLHVATNTAPELKEEYAQDPPASLSLQDAMMDKLAVRTPFRSLYDRVVAWICRKAFQHELSRFRSIFTTHLLPKNSLQRSTKNFASGTPQNLTDALRQCRAEKTTLLGPICIGIALAMAKASGIGLATESNGRIKLNLSVDYNLRERVQPSMGKEHVGCNIGIGFLASYENQGIPMDALFWDVARACKAEAEASGKGFIFSSLFSLSHYEMQNLDEMTQGSTDGAAGDVNVSNLGRWPFGQEIGPLHLDRIHLYHRTANSGMDSAIVFFITSIDALHYSMTSSLANQAGMADIVFRNAVQCIEFVGRIGPRTTVREFMHLVLA